MPSIVNHEKSEKTGIDNPGRRQWATMMSEGGLNAN